jgi:hypothetical protein
VRARRLQLRRPNRGHRAAVSHGPRLSPKDYSYSVARFRRKQPAPSVGGQFDTRFVASSHTWS